MNHFEYRDGELACEDLDLRPIAEAVGTPVYVYSTATLERHYTVFRDALRGAGVVEPMIAYAVKANPNLSVLKTLFALGAGADTVSMGEIRRALAAGAPPERIVFSGVGKTAEELAFAIDAGVAEINVESEPELDALIAVAADKGARPEGPRFLVLDAAMNDLIRPALYEAFHEIKPLRQPEADAAPVTYDVVGPICETGDTFARERALPPLKAGDLVAFLSAGAYGASMSSEYNSRLLVPEVLVRGDRYAVVRPRPTYEDMLAREPLAPWL